MYLVSDLYEQHGKRLGLELVAGKDGITRPIRVPEVQRPGLSLSGYLKHHSYKRILIFGKVEIEYLRDITPKERIQRLKSLLSSHTPAIIVARSYRPPKELAALCEQYQVPLLRATASTMNLISKLTRLLSEEFATTVTLHGTLVEVYGVGVLIKGDSSVGKSEAALGLIERGHRLISDDTVRVRKTESSYLEGHGAAITRHLMEIRGIGIINVANLYGAVCVRESKSIDLIVELETWNDHHFYDRIGLEDKVSDIMGVRIPHHTLPVKPGRDVVLLLETIALNHRLKEMGYNSAKEFSNKLQDVILANEHKSKKRGIR